MSASNISNLPTGPPARPSVASASAPSVAAAPSTDSFVKSETLVDHLAKLAGTTAQDPSLRPRVSTLIEKELSQTLDGVVRAWRTVQVNKAAFPFQVAKQARIYGPQAAAQLAANKSAVATLMANPNVTRMMLNDLETGLCSSAPVPAVPDLNDAQFRAFHDAVHRAAMQTSNYTTYAAIAVVGWGAGDHKSVASENCPTGPKGTSSHLAIAITNNIFEQK